ncbi:unnamed protein product [Paramecium sonneborni]|uniref:Uncharacterized protein n=1 Tax=Paramecium sonneborni TaxID=65129 RepID=A0A8S1RK56_9CILI|nr:unnamed protein product [Paramecium sonneborni]
MPEYFHNIYSKYQSIISQYSISIENQFRNMQISIKFKWIITLPEDRKLISQQSLNVYQIMNLKQANY